MSKVAIVYWSMTGNTEAMANAVKEGVNGDAELIQAADFSADQLGTYDAVAFGCPAMGSEELEESEFEPMFAGLESSLSGVRVGLFGSYDWGDGEWMRTWKSRCEEDGAVLVAEPVICNLEPDDDGLAACKALGAALA